MATMVKLLVTNRFITPKTQVRVARRWFRRVGIVFLFFCFLAALFHLVFKSDYFVVKNINCWVQDKTSLADEKRWCEQARRELIGQRILFLSLKSEPVEGVLRSRFLPIGNVAVKRKLPQTVLVQINERKPIAKVCPPGGREFLVDEEGATFSEVTPETKDLKKVSLELGLELALGQRLGEDVIFLILLEDPQVRSIKYIGQEGIEVQAEENLAILFSREKNLEAQARSLQMIVQKYKIEGKELKQVDLRYEQPVVKY